MGCQKPNNPKEFLEKLKVEYLISCVAYDSMFKSLYEVLEVFHKAGIKFILLKSSHLARFVYNDIEMRQMGDIDILVKKIRKNPAVILLIELRKEYQNGEQSSIHSRIFK